jgi:hypothetical protein
MRHEQLQLDRKEMMSLSPQWQNSHQHTILKISNIDLEMICLYI